MAAKKKKIAKSAAVEKNLATAMDKLATACTEGDAAVASRAKDSKKLLSQVRRLSKRKATLQRKKQTAKRKVDKDPSADTRRNLREVTKDLAATTKELAKARAAKAANALELSALKAAHKRANAYQKAISKIDKQLSKPRKTRRRKKS